ncbi:ALP1-like protein isoform X1 [Tanacetum coccineum]
MSERSSRTALDHFCQAVMEKFGPEYLRKPSVTDVEKLYRHHEEMHGQYVKRDHGPNPFILLEAVASQDLWKWHAFFGVAGSNNDINVLYQSPLFNDLKTGRAPEIPFVANGVTYPWTGTEPSEALVVLTMAFSVDGDINQKKSEASGLWLSRVPRNTTNTSSSKSRSKGKSIIKVKKETDNVDCEILWEDLITKEQIGQAKAGIDKERCGTSVWCSEKEMGHTSQSHTRAEKERIMNMTYTCIILHDMIQKFKGVEIFPRWFPEEAHHTDGLVQSNEQVRQVMRWIRSAQAHQNFQADLIEHLSCNV